MADDAAPDWPDALFDTLSAPDKPLGLAVSGGSDSMALLHLAASWAKRHGTKLRVATVHHGLRTAADDECAFVGRTCQSLDIPHDVLRWQWDGNGNLQASARRGRYDRLGSWARTHGIASIALGHTMDDQAETVLMNLGRGSGLDGLSAMAPSSQSEGVKWVRPLLGQRRSTLREMLSRQGRSWCDDTSNEDTGFERVRMRKTLSLLEPHGITPETLAATAERLQAQRAVVDAAVADLARAALSWGRAGEANLDAVALSEALPELRSRLLDRVIRSIGGAVHPIPREAVDRAIGDSGGATLSGCLIRPEHSRIVIAREPARAAAAVPLDADCETIWDRRWRLSDASGWPEGCTVGALGIVRPVDTPLPAPPLRATLPAIRDAEGTVLAVPPLAITTNAAPPNAQVRADLIAYQFRSDAGVVR